MISPPHESPSGNDLVALFPSGDYRFQMRMGRVTIPAFFAARDGTGEILKERQKWLACDPDRYASLLPEGRPALDEWLELSASMQTTSATTLGRDASDATAAFIKLGGSLEPDLLLLQPDHQDGEFRLVGGCVCFPSAWSLPEKLGRPLLEIHSVVPGLNAQLAAPINQFLHRLTPGTAWCRENWGLSASPELNQHPARTLPRLHADVSLDQVWLRVERQALVALPHTRSVCFGIRVESHALAAVRVDTKAREGLLRALSTMPDAVAEYKGLAPARDRIVQLLSE
jgi:dimethylamine monooxygenase subunit A